MKIWLVLFLVEDFTPLFTEAVASPLTITLVERLPKKILKGTNVLRNFEVFRWGVQNVGRLEHRYTAQYKKLKRYKGDKIRRITKVPNTIWLYGTAFGFLFAHKMIRKL
jgi:hypothetical protein